MGYLTRPVDLHPKIPKKNKILKILQEMDPARPPERGIRGAQPPGKKKKKGGMSVPTGRGSGRRLYELERTIPGKKKRKDKARMGGGSEEEGRWEGDGVRGVRR